MQEEDPLQWRGIGSVHRRYVHELEARLSRMEALLEKYASGEQSSGSSSPHRSDQNELVTAQNLSSGVSQQFDALTLADYARTKYIGISAGVHLLDDDVFRFKRRVKLENRGILQKVNDDEDEHVLVRSQVASHPPVRPSFEYHRSSLFSENLPQMTVELADHLVELFFKYIHLYLPILNKITFLEQYYFANPHPPERNLIYSVWSISLWITLSDGTQLAGGPLVDADIIKELRNTLRQNVCQAAEKAHTQSSITTLQWLILASLIIEFCEEEDIFRFRLVYYWCCDSDGSRSRVASRRIWHCINLIDKWIAADLGRPPTIADEDFDVEWPTATELASPYNTLDAPDIPEILVQAREDLTRQRPIYSIFQAATMTTSILDQILRGFYSPKKQSSEIPNLELAKKLEAELQQWRNTIWPSVWHVNNPCSPFPGNG
ncbi:hypothetical protein VTP01DRAFT_8422 [Rhizomucor pusillus]|uniref:uncharacterized protein n=1 Tax=Rhizomucor pusillus TaxID=4840 RepID=UPI003741FD3D